MASDEQINNVPEEPASETPPPVLPERQDDTETLRRVLDRLTDLAA